MSGGQPSLVLLHAFGAAGRSYAPLAARLGGFEVHAPDLPGFGDAPPLSKPSVGAYADWVEAFVSRAGLEDAVLGGWSMGGKIALALAARRPEWLTSLVLIAPSPPGPEPMDEADRRAQLDGYGDPVLARRSVEALTKAHPPQARIDQTVADRLRTSESAWRWWLEDGSRETLSVSVTQPAPTLVVVGAQDPNLGEAVQRRETLPHLADPRLVSLEGCGHFLPLEAPDRLSASLSAWLEPPASTELSAASA